VPVPVSKGSNGSKPFVAPHDENMRRQQEVEDDVSQAAEADARPREPGESQGREGWRGTMGHIAVVVAVVVRALTEPYRRAHTHARLHVGRVSV